MGFVPVRRHQVVKAILVPSGLHIRKKKDFFCGGWGWGRGGVGVRVSFFYKESKSKNKLSFGGRGGGGGGLEYVIFFTKNPNLKKRF